MPSVTVVDLSAESRSNIACALNALIAPNHPCSLILPRLSVRAAGPEEISFCEAPDLFVVGAELVSKEPSRIADLKRACPESRILALLPPAANSLPLARDLQRFGADEAACSSALGEEDLARRLIFLINRRKVRELGKLVVVVGAKGGLGATSITAALGDGLSRGGAKTALVDWDFESQDLSRFLKARPLVSEDLAVLLSGSRPLSEESARQCLSQIWADQPLFCCPPPPVVDGAGLSGSEPARRFLSFLEALAESFDFLLVDASHAVGELFKYVVGAADQVLLILSGDPACAYAGLGKARQILELLAVESDLVLLENSSGVNQFSPIAGSEMLASLTAANARWLGRIDHSPIGAHWPASGETLYSLSRGANRASFELLIQSLEDRESIISNSGAGRWADGFHKTRALIERTARWLINSDGGTLALPEPAPRASPQTVPLLSKPNFVSS